MTSKLHCRENQTKLNTTQKDQTVNTIKVM